MDNGLHFMGEFHELCVRLGVQHRFGMPYHPQTTGQDERSNGLLLNRIRKWHLEDYKHWDDDLPSSLFACNTRKVLMTSFSAMESLMGFTTGTTSKLRLMPLSKKELAL